MLQTTEWVSITARMFPLLSLESFLNLRPRSTLETPYSCQITRYRVVTPMQGILRSYRTMVTLSMVPTPRVAGHNLFIGGEHCQDLPHGLHCPDLLGLHCPDQLDLHCRERVEELVIIGWEAIDGSSPLNTETRREPVVKQLEENRTWSIICPILTLRWPSCRLMSPSCWRKQSVSWWLIVWRREGT